MGCNCKVNQKIDYLHRKYGNKIPVSKKTEISFHFKEKIKEFFVFLIGLLFLPIIILFVLYKVIFTKEKKVSIKKLMKLADVRN